VKLEATAIDGVWLVASTPYEDARGSFTRTFCRDTFLAHGLDARVAQCALSFNSRRGTLRGMHYQAAPHEEAKLVRCLRGRIHDVALDLRPTSPTFGRWLARELSPDAPLALYLAPGIAHGFLTLEDDSEVLYQLSVPRAPDAARGVRWDDPRFAIAWPLAPSLVSERDRGFPDFAPPPPA
jgi:dTDP-4-dehydrorhamnose 3,5-epimerase